MKFTSLMLIGLLVVSSIGVSSAIGFEDAYGFGMQSQSNGQGPQGMGPQDMGQQGMGQMDRKAHLESTLETLVSEGVLTSEEAENLIQYLEDNRPEPGMGGPQQGSNPIDDAASEGIITEEQASQIHSLLRPNGQMDGGQGQQSMEQGFGTNQGPQGMSQGNGLQQGPQGMNQNFGTNANEQSMNQGLDMDQMQQGMGPGMNTMDLSEAQLIETKLLAEVGYTSEKGGYPIVDTGLTAFYSNTGTISEPDSNESYYGQDASYTGNQSSYTDNGDGTITDNVTGLMWQQDPGEKMTWEEAVENLDEFELGGYTDWRLPTIKELYSLVQFDGETGRSAEDSTPYLDTNYFEFTFGDETGERFIDSQMATSTIYESTTMHGNTTMFGFNFADGRIKGYGTSKTFYVYYVRGNTNYGQNQFVDNGDGTITDEATGLMWLTYDSGYYNAGDNSDGTMDWDDALEWSEDLEVAGYDDWKLPDAKELQSIVDYTRSPDTTGSAAIDPLFYSTSITNLAGQTDYGFYWTSTTHLDGMQFGSRGIYVAFGRGMGEMNDTIMDVHGAGCQRSDAKTGSRSDYPESGHGPQGDVQRVFNMVRAVRNID